MEMESGFLKAIFDSFDVSFAYNFIYLAEVILMIFLGKWLFNYITSYSLTNELTNKDNLAVALATNGYLVGIAIIAIAANLGETATLLDGILEIAQFSFLGMLLLLISKFLNEKFILKKFSVRKELIEDKNAGTGAVVLGNYIASALIIAEAITVEGGGFLFVLLFYIVGQIFLISFAHFYAYIMPYDLHSELEKDNVAVGISFAGALIAMSIILMKGFSSNTVEFIPNIVNFIVVGVVGVIILSALRILFAKYFVFSVDLNREIAIDRNVGVALIEASMMLIISFSLFFSI
ncbi:MAG: DUF350 domain-containing protein [Oligoflexia bacterium]|nr:DUF350 domain-containing protein [Oligoflexia bacterium]